MSQRHARPPGAGATVATFARVSACAQPMHGGVQLALDRAFREPERVGDLAELQPLMMAHDEHDPLAVRQPVDLRFEHLARARRHTRGPRDRALFRRVRASCCSASSPNGAEPAGRLPAPVIDTGVHDDSIHPRRQLRVLAELVERPIDLDEDFLRNVLGVVVVPGELIGDAIHHRPMTLDERLKGGRVAARRAGDQIRSGDMQRSASERSGSQAPHPRGWPCHPYDAAGRRRLIGEADDFV